VYWGECFLAAGNGANALRFNRVNAIQESTSEYARF
jgi:hypothetical protein